jgi:hypothetical protein
MRISWWHLKGGSPVGRDLHGLVSPTGSWPIRLAFRATPAEDMRMKTFIADLLILASAIAALAATCASQPQERSINETAEVGKEIRNLNAREVDAFIHNDPKTMAQL